MKNCRWRNMLHLTIWYFSIEACGVTVQQWADVIHLEQNTQNKGRGIIYCNCGRPFLCIASMINILARVIKTILQDMSGNSRIFWSIISGAALWEHLEAFNNRIFAVGFFLPFMEDSQVRLMQLVNCSKATLCQHLMNISGLPAILRD